MKKVISILEIILILLIITIAFMLSLKFFYTIQIENLNEKYYLDIKISELIVEDDSKLDDISYNNETLNLNVTFKEENDFCKIKMKIKNNGSLSAKLNDITNEINANNQILKYEITYENHEQLKKGDIIESNEEKTIIIFIYYPKQDKKIYDELTLQLKLILNYDVIQ